MGDISMIKSWWIQYKEDVDLSFDRLEYFMLNEAVYVVLLLFTLFIAFLVVVSFIDFVLTFGGDVIDYMLKRNTQENQKSDGMEDDEP